MVDPVNPTTIGLSDVISGSVQIGRNFDIIVSDSNKSPKMPTADRIGTLATPSYSNTEAELKDVLAALENPPKRVDWLGAAVGCFSSAFFAWKTYDEASGMLSGRNLVAFGVALIVAAVYVGRVIEQSRDPKALQALALSHVKKVLAMKSTE